MLQEEAGAAEPADGGFAAVGICFYGLAFAAVLLTFLLTGHIAASPLVASTHLTVCRRSSQSETCSAGSWKEILATLHFTSCAWQVTATSDFKVTVMSLAQPAWRCPT